MKYIIFRHENIEYPVIFPISMTHTDVAKYIPMKPVSAGFVDIASLVCFGRSESLNLSSREQDSKILDMHSKIKILGGSCVKATSSGSCAVCDCCES